MDDLPDKLRRNVVVLSAAIVAITVFHLSFKPTGTLLGFAEVRNITPVKVWLALTAVLIYVFLRYWFHEETDKELALLQQEFQGLRYAAIKRHLEQDFGRYLLEQRVPSSVVDFNALPDARLDSLLAAHGPAARAEVSACVDPDRRLVDFTFDTHWESGARHTVAQGRRYPYKLKPSFIVVATVRSGLRTTLCSKSAVDVVVPLALATLAAIMCAYQLGAAGASA